MSRENGQESGEYMGDHHDPNYPVAKKLREDAYEISDSKERVKILFNVLTLLAIPLPLCAFLVQQSPGNVAEFLNYLQIMDQRLSADLLMIIAKTAQWCSISTILLLQGWKLRILSKRDETAATLFDDASQL